MRVNKGYVKSLDNLVQHDPQHANLNTIRISLMPEAADESWVLDSSASNVAFASNEEYTASLARSGLPTELERPCLPLT